MRWVTVFVFAVSACAQDAVSILRQRCQSCHTDLGYFARLARAGPLDANPLLRTVIGERARMPKDGALLTDREVALLRQWVKDGARLDAKPSPNANQAPPAKPNRAPDKNVEQ